MKMVFYIYSKCLKRKKLYYFMNYRMITTILNQKNNLTKRNSFNKLYSHYKIRNEKFEKLKNEYLMNESESCPFTPRLSFHGGFYNPNKLFPSVDNFGKKYFYYSNYKFPSYRGMNCLKRFDYNPKKIIKNYRIDEENKEYSNIYNLKDTNKRNFNGYKNQKSLFSISSRINKNINDQISQYMNNIDLLKTHKLLNKTNPNISKKSEEKQSCFKLNESKSKNKKKNNKINHKLLCYSNKSLNPSSTNGGIEFAKTNYTNPPKNSNNNFKNGNNIFSNINSASSRINDTTNNNSRYLNGIKMVSGVKEFFYDFYPGNRNNNNEQRTELLSLQSINDSKMLELASKYIDEEDDSSENYKMNNILHSRKKYKNKINQ